MAPLSRRFLAGSLAIRSWMVCAVLLTLPPGKTQLTAQVAGGHAVVLSNGAASGAASTLYDVDPDLGTIRPLGRFLSDTLPGQALTLDPVQGDAVLALRLGGASLIVRVSLLGGRAAGETVLATTTAPVTDLEISLDGDIYACTGGDSGQVLQIPRTGGPPAVLIDLPHATAIEASNLGAGALMIASSPNPTAGTPAKVTSLDIFSRAILAGPYSLPSLNQHGVTGLGRRYASFASMLIDEGGNSWIVNLPADVRPFGPQVSLAPGSLQALKLDAFPLRWLALGDARSPYLRKRSDSTTSLLGWQDAAGPIPGDPVDFSVQRRAPYVYRFGSFCPRPAGFPLSVQSAGQPQLGDRGFAVSATNATGGSSVVILLGYTDLWAGSVRLPVTLPGGCRVLVGPEVAAAVRADSGGTALAPLPIPNDPSLVDFALLAQALELPTTAGGRIFASPGLTMHVGR